MLICLNYCVAKVNNEQHHFNYYLLLPGKNGNGILSDPVSIKSYKLLLMYHLHAFSTNIIGSALEAVEINTVYQVACVQFNHGGIPAYGL